MSLESYCRILFLRIQTSAGTKFGFKIIYSHVHQASLELYNTVHICIDKHHSKLDVIYLFIYLSIYLFNLLTASVPGSSYSSIQCDAEPLTGDTPITVPSPAF